MQSSRAVFLDRDGVLNRNVYYGDTGMLEAPRTAECFELFPWVPAALTALRDAGYLLFVVSNQPNFALGKASLEDFSEIHERLITTLQAEGIELQASYYCLHHPTSVIPGYKACECRKPSPHFVFKAAKAYSLDLKQSWFVGDRITDILCGQRAEVSTILVDGVSTPDSPEPTFRAHTLEDAVRYILD